MNLDEDFEDDQDDFEVDGGYSFEQESELRVFAKRFQGNVTALAKEYIVHFFCDKMMHCGGKIPKSLLLSEKRISMVLNYDIIKGVEGAYQVLEYLATREDKLMAKITGEVTSDIKLVNETLNLLARSCIPQQFAGGMLLLYLEFVEGVDIGIRR